MTTALEKAKQRRAELDAKIKRDELRELARSQCKALLTALTKRDYANLDVSEDLNETCHAIGRSIMVIAESEGGE